MHLQVNEVILRVIHHHPTPFVAQVFKLVLAFFPFFLLLFVGQDSVSTASFMTAELVLFAFFALVLVYLGLIFWLDKLVITNHRIIYINWKFLTVRNESEARLEDIQDVRTKERGILSYFIVFDYGLFQVDTASSSAILVFDNAPNPEGIRQYVYHLRSQ